MSATANIQIDKLLLESLNKIKEYPGQTYNELIASMIEAFRNIETRNQHDEFFHKIQGHKMKELWDNEYDKEWEKV
ncbi:MAG: hypothetical protein CVT88_01285 [Candidatus Altiarchaeales archaeon HGW-Altiarchaeales-1]|nr:MAG: hypothetical protein CVT88_01285 [Candidatus Altiarchaeales archaeon HGW-Altiarchaeales-1]